MRRRDLDRLITYFRIAVDAVLYNKFPGKDQALADLSAELEKFRQQGDWQVTGCDVPTSTIALVVSTLRMWTHANSDALREGLTGWAVSSADTLAKWLDGDLLAPRDPRAGVSAAIGG